ncbi:hypothetical protein BD413DRAFT_573984 [Trametes elegans]|nr:hypothetical protein BD413DRAFT_573984 [Trametes elegans]
MTVPTFLLYDYLLTLEQEVKLFWNRKFTGASALFFFTRYATLIAYNILGCISFAHLFDPVCAVLTRAQAALTIFEFIPWAAFSALRVFALSGMHWPLAVVVFLLALIPAGVNFAQFGFGLTGANLLTTGCQAQTNATPEQNEIFVILSRSGLVVADALVIAVTLVKTRKRGTTPHFGRSSKVSLADVLLRDGLIYFATLLCFNTIDLALTIISYVTPYNQTSYVTALSDPLTAVLVGRFLLDLQASNRSTMELGGSHSSDLGSFPDLNGTLHFATVIGSLGAEIVPGSITPESGLYSV